MATKKTTKKQTTARRATKKPSTRRVAKNSAGAKASAKPKKLSAIDAASKVLAEAKQPMTSREMIEAMAAKKYWNSPGGKTPWATLYSAIAREITKRGKESRFKKAGRGKFALNG